MTISDQKLSAFIDNELSPGEMQQIRDLISADETLADRLAQISMVDHAVNKTVHAIDRKPIPVATEQLLARHEEAQHEKIPTQSENVVQFPVLRSFNRVFKEYGAIAAMLMLVLGFSAGSYFSADDSEPQLWDQVSVALNETTSGASVSLDSDWTIKPRVSFKNTNDQYCRLFSLQSAQASHDNIACQNQGGWQLYSRISTSPEALNSYKTASVNEVTDTLVDSIIQGSFLNKAQEAKVIEQEWKDQ